MYRFIRPPHLDNFAKLSEIPNNLKSIHILITSREQQEKFYQIPLEFLERTEARELLLGIAKREPKGEQDEKDIENLLEELSDLPLAIELVGGYLSRHKNVSFKEYLNFLNQFPLSDLEDKFPNSSFTAHDKSIIRTLKVSEKLIDKNPLIGEILDILTWSGKSSLGYSLLSELVQAKNEFTFKSALGEALDLRLIKHDKVENRYSIHRLLSRVRQLETPLEDKKEWHRKIIRGFETWFENLVNKQQNYLEFKSEVEHLIQWQKMSLKHIPKESAYLTALVGDIFSADYENDKAKSFYKDALALIENFNITDYKILVYIFDCLGSIEMKDGNISQSVYYLSKVLKIEEARGNQGLIWGCHNNLGAAYCLGKQDRKAFFHKQKAYEIAVKLHGANHIKVAPLCYRLAHGYKRLKQYKKAAEYYKKAISIFEVNNEELSLEAATMYGEFGRMNLAIRNKEKSVLYLEKQLSILRKYLPDSHPQVYLCTVLVIEALIKAKDRKKANKLKDEFRKNVPINSPFYGFFENMDTNINRKKKKRKKKK